MSYGVVRHINHYNGGDHWDVSTRSVGDGPSHLVTPLSYEFYCTPTPGTPNRLSVSGPAGLDATVCATARSGACAIALASVGSTAAGACEQKLPIQY